ncbi:MAG: hypothetical protein AAB425_02945, partial [Bdellovibrionota bacterium]
EAKTPALLAGLLLAGCGIGGYAEKEVTRTSVTEVDSAVHRDGDTITIPIFEMSAEDCRDASGEMDEVTQYWERVYGTYLDKIVSYPSEVTIEKADGTSSTSVFHFLEFFDWDGQYVDIKQYELADGRGTDVYDLGRLSVFEEKENARSQFDSIRRHEFVCDTGDKPYTVSLIGVINPALSEAEAVSFSATLEAEATFLVDGGELILRD